MPQPTAAANAVLIISHDVVGKQMAGPGIRYYRLAQVLAREFPTTLAIPAGSTLTEAAEFSLLAYESGEDPALEVAIQEANAILVPSIFVATVPLLARLDTPLIVDGYDPIVAEVLSFQAETIDNLQTRLRQAYRLGDFFICASERQRDWWLGLLEAHGRLNPANFRADPSLRRLLDIVPYGLPEDPPQHTRPIIKGVWPGIEADNRVLLWGGGLWSWLDPLTAIRAVAELWPQEQDIRLVFPGTRHPNPQMLEAPTHNQAARQLAQNLGLLDKAVFFGDWLPYADWPNALLESDLALTLHFDTLETRLAFRSRALTYIWADLPIIATRGDAVSELVAQYQLGAVVNYESVSDVATAILGLLNTPRDTFQPRFAQIQQLLTWEVAAQPLIRFCRQPTLAADKLIANPTSGVADYQQALAAAQTTIGDLQALVTGYERGRFIRFMRWLKGIKN